MWWAIECGNFLLQFTNYPKSGEMLHSKPLISLKLTLLKHQSVLIWVFNPGLEGKNEVEPEIGLKGSNICCHPLSPEKIARPPL